MNPSSPDELMSIRNYVNRNFSGWQLGAVWVRELLRRIPEERALYDDAHSQLQALCSKGLLEVDITPEVHMEGASNLLALDLRLTREKMRQLLRALEEKCRLMELLDRFLDLPPGELDVRMGLEEIHPSMKDLALIGANVRIGGLPACWVAVLGPMRMHYERAMAQGGPADQPGPRKRALLKWVDRFVKPKQWTPRNPTLTFPTCLPTPTSRPKLWTGS